MTSAVDPFHKSITTLASANQPIFSFQSSIPDRPPSAPSHHPAQPQPDAPHRRADPQRGAAEGADGGELYEADSAWPLGPAGLARSAGGLCAGGWVIRLHHRRSCHYGSRRFLLKRLGIERKTCVRAEKKSNNEALFERALTTPPRPRAGRNDQTGEEGSAQLRPPRVRERRRKECSLSRTYVPLLSVQLPTAFLDRCLTAPPAME